MDDVPARGLLQLWRRVSLEELLDADISSVVAAFRNAGTVILLRPFLRAMATSTPDT
jgi:hypothetical protein